MKGAMEHKVVAMALDAEAARGDAKLAERLIAKWAADGWTLVSLATPNPTYALVAFSRPKPQPGDGASK